MKRIIIAILAGILTLTPSVAQSRKAVKQAKKDAKLEVKYLKSEGYKALDNEKLEDAVYNFLVTKYSTKKNVTEVVGKGTGKDISEAKAEARQDALYGYPDSDIADHFFVYEKTRGRFEVLCYALVVGRSAKDAAKDRTQIRRRSDGTEAGIDKMKAENEAKIAKEKEKKERQKAKKKAREAQRKAEKAQRKAAEAARN